MSERGLIATIVLLVACGDNIGNGPFDELRLDGDFVVGVDKPVHVARDQFGVAHISAQSVADAAFVQGYVMAHDRLPQMDILRRFGAGTLSELFGALDPTVIDTDLEMRMHRMKPLAQASWEVLSASNEPTDKKLVLLLQRFADGVNAYAAAIRSDANPSGVWELDPELLASFDPERFVPWVPVDTLVLGRFQAFALSWTTQFEIDATEMYQGLRATFDAAVPGDAAAFARRGISRDLMKLTPVGTRSTIDGFPNVDTDSGTRSDGSGTRSRRSRSARGHLGPPRPTVPQQLFDQARAFFRRSLHTGAFETFGPHALMYPHAGSNNWAVGPSITGDGTALLATDQHLRLANPSIFYPTHLTIHDEVIDTQTTDGTLVPAPFDVLGVTFPGIPGVILGTNGKLAWSGTVSEHDVNDVYLETITPCGANSCVTFNGAQVPVETFTEEIKIGALGTITDTRIATYEVVPHHGPIIPTIVNHALVPRTGTTAMSVKYSGYVPTYELRAVWNLGHARNVDEGFEALVDFTYGSQNWTMIDNATTIGWTTNAFVPNRAPAAYAWDPTTNPDGIAPFFVLPGDGSAEWQGRMSSRYVPHGINPPSGFFATANADPVGATFDGLPLNQPVVDGRPLYVGVSYVAGLREQRITTLIEENTPVSLDDMARIQHDTHSNAGEKLVPPVLAALEYLDQTAGAPADVAPYLAALPTADRDRLVAARTLLAAWRFETPSEVEVAHNDAAATSVFNTWMHFFVVTAIKDELDAINFDLSRISDDFVVRIVYAMLTNPASFVQSISTQQPVVCDRFATPGADDSCTKLILMAMVDAMMHLESSAGFGTADIAQWAWGKLHRLRISPLFPNSALDLPGPGQPGFPKAGDNFAINYADPGWNDLDFSQDVRWGPAQRFLAVASPGKTITVKWALPGGVIYDSRSPHYRDLLDNYYLPQTHFDAPYLVTQINAAGESRWIFR